MKKKVYFSLSAIVILSLIMIYGCKKEDNDPKYDLFPCKVGNEYFYDYSYQYSFSLGIPPISISKGKMKWTILSNSSKNGVTEYYFEEKFDGVDITVNSTSDPSLNDTVDINGRIRHFKLVENSSAQLTFYNFSEIDEFNATFPRYYDKPDNLIGLGDIHIMCSYSFRADSGLTKYTYTDGPNFNLTDESYTLYDVKLVK